MIFLTLILHITGRLQDLLQKGVNILTRLLDLAQMILTCVLIVGLALPVVVLYLAGLGQFLELVLETFTTINSRLAAAVKLLCLA